MASVISLSINEKRTEGKQGDDETKRGWRKYQARIYKK